MRRSSAEKRHTSAIQARTYSCARARKRKELNGMRGTLWAHSARTVNCVYQLCNKSGRLLHELFARIRYQHNLIHTYDIMKLGLSAELKK